VLNVPGREYFLTDDTPLDVLSMFVPMPFIFLNFAKTPVWGDSYTKIVGDVFKRIHSTNDSKKGALVIVEADAGVGKTRLAQQIIEESPMAVYYGAGNPFEISKALYPFRDLILQVLDDDIATAGLKDAQPFNRRKVITEKLKALKSPAPIAVTVFTTDAKDKDAPKDNKTQTPEELAPVLNELFQTEFTETDSPFAVGSA
jgi:hypothetical protein